MLSVTRTVLLGLVIFVAGNVAALAWQGGDIVHDSQECLPTDNFTMFTAGYEPPEDVQTFRLYFKSDLSPDYYYIDLELGVDGFTSPLPRPTSESRTVSYYIEMVDRSFNSVRTVQFDANVVESADECRRRNPAVAFFTGGDPELVIRNLSGIPVLPLGFQAQGIASLGGAGIGAGTVAVAGAVVAGATAGVLAATGGDAPPPSPAPTPPSAVMTPPPVAPAAPPSPTVTACIETSPSPPVIEEGGRIKLDGRCSEPVGAINFFWELDGVRTRTGPFIEPVYPDPGVYTVRLTIELKSGFTQGVQLRAPIEEITVTVTQAAPPEPEPSVNQADLQVSKTAPATQDCVSGEAFFDIIVTNQGPLTATGVTLIDTIQSEFANEFDFDGGCPGATFNLNVGTCPIGTLGPGETFTLTVVLDADGACFDDLDEGDSVTNMVEVTANEFDSNPSNNKSTASFIIGDLSDTFSVLGNTSFTSTLTPLASRVTGARAVVRLNRESTWNVGARMHRHTGRAAKGFQEVEGVLLAPVPGGATWRFSFEGDTAFVRGSLRVESGEILSREAGAVVFRLNGAPGERVRFRYRRGR